MKKVTYFVLLSALAGCSSTPTQIPATQTTTYDCTQPFERAVTAPQLHCLDGEWAMMATSAWIKFDRLAKIGTPLRFTTDEPAGGYLVGQDTANLAFAPLADAGEALAYPYVFVIDSQDHYQQIWPLPNSTLQPVKLNAPWTLPGDQEWRFDQADTYQIAVLAFSQPLTVAGPIDPVQIRAFMGNELAQGRAVYGGNTSFRAVNP